jgi:hypothetical protein
MLSYQDCLHFSELQADEIRAIAEHENVPDIVAAQLGAGLLKSAQGVRAIELMMLENVERAHAHGRLAKMDRQSGVYARFRAQHSQ